MLTVSLERMKRLRGRRRAGLGPGWQPGGPTHRHDGLPRSPLEAEAGGQVGAVAVGDVGVVLQEHGDLLVRVQANVAGHHYGPVLVAAQLDVVRAPQQLLLHLARPAAAAASARAPQACRDDRDRRPPGASAPLPSAGARLAAAVTRPPQRREAMT